MILAQTNPTQSLPPLPEGPSMDSLRGPVEVPLLQPWQWGLIAFACIIFVILGIFFIRKAVASMRRKKSPPSPYVIARNTIEQTTKNETADDDIIAVELSLSIRRYLETEWHFKVLGRTTQEFLEHLQKDKHLPGQEQSILRDFLNQCDQIKFSRGHFVSGQRDKLSQIALNLIESLHSKKIAEIEKKGGTR